MSDGDKPPRGPRRDGGRGGDDRGPRGRGPGRDNRGPGKRRDGKPGGYGGGGPRRDGKPGFRKGGNSGPRRDGPRRDGPRRDGPRRDGPRNDGPRPRNNAEEFATPDQEQFRYLVTASRGTEPMLRHELKDLGLDSLSEVPGGVTFKGTLRDGMRATLWTRIGQRVLLEIGRGRVNGGDQLYGFVRSLALPAWFDADSTLAVFAATKDCGFQDDRFAGQKTKDAIVDAMRAKYRRRPDVDPKNPDVSVTLHAKMGHARLYLDLAGGPLHIRGARIRDVDAPVKENLAAALLQYAGWDGRRPLHDPTCGGGTIAIEAAGIAANAAPALGRPLGFERWPGYAEFFEPAWMELVDEAEQVAKPSVRGVIIASDIDKKAVRATRANLAAAGFLDDVVVRMADARETPALRSGGHFVFNPPYGERIGGTDEKVAALYDEIAARLLAYDDHTVALISTENALAEGFGGAEPTRGVGVLNGKLRCQMLVYEQ